MRTPEYMRLSRETLDRADLFYKEMAVWMDARDEASRLAALEHALAYNRAIDDQFDYVRKEVSSDDQAFQICLQHKQSLASQIQLLTQ